MKYNIRTLKLIQILPFGNAGYWSTVVLWGCFQNSLRWGNTLAHWPLCKGFLGGTSPLHREPKMCLLTYSIFSWGSSLSVNVLNIGVNKAETCCFTIGPNKGISLLWHLDFLHMVYCGFLLPPLMFISISFPLAWHSCQCYFSALMFDTLVTSSELQPVALVKFINTPAHTHIQKCHHRPFPCKSNLYTDFPTCLVFLEGRLGFQLCYLLGVWWSGPDNRGESKGKRFFWRSKVAVHFVIWPYL